MAFLFDIFSKFLELKSFYVRIINTGLVKIVSSLKIFGVKNFCVYKVKLFGTVFCQKRIKQQIFVQGVPNVSTFF
jgi:hypothetical protein